jgi:anthranilate phosphoribosyltransferase
MTDTGMVDGIRDMWNKEGLPVNQPKDVARVMLEVAIGKVSGKGIAGAGARWNGSAVFVAGGRGWDIEEGINETEELWLGKDVSRTLNRGQEVLGDGTDWAGSSKS